MSRIRKELTILKRVNSLRHAIRGVAVYLETTPNAWVHIVSALVLVGLGMYFDISTLEWALLLLANGVVLVAEAFNSSIEIHMDLTSPQRNEYARDTKDIAAGAVLIAGVTAWVIDLLILVPYLARIS